MLDGLLFFKMCCWIRYFCRMLFGIVGGFYFIIIVFLDVDDSFGVDKFWGFVSCYKMKSIGFLGCYLV